MPELTGVKDIRSYFRTLWRWKWVFLAFVIAAPAVAYLLEHNKPSVYSSSALVGVDQTTVNTSGLDSSGSFSTTNVTAIAELVTTSPVADVAASLMTPRANPAQIVSEVTATGDTSTNFLTIQAQDHSPERAAAIANAFAEAISLNLRHSAIGQIDSAISGIRSQLARLRRGDVTARLGFQQQLNQLLAARTSQGSEAAILQHATPSATPVSTSLRRVIELAVLIGIVLGIGAVALLESMDRRLRSPEDIDGLGELPLLGSIPARAFGASLETTSDDDEAFQMLRTALMYFNVDHLDSVLFTSAGEQEGKTTVATRLAIVGAQAGMDVILVDADLRRGQASARFGIRGTEGLGTVLAGGSGLDEALFEYDIAGATAGRLRILPSGHPPPNPAALISSQQMLDVLSALEAKSDLVIIDTPPALAVSDTVALMPTVTGVVVVARMNHVTRHGIRRVQQLVASTHGNLLGVVATGVSGGDAYYGQYATKYSDAAAPRRSRRHKLPGAPLAFRRSEKDEADPTFAPAPSVNGERREQLAEELPSRGAPSVE